MKFFDIRKLFNLQSQEAFDFFSSSWTFYEPDFFVNFTCAIYLYLRWRRHTIFSVKCSSCMESKPSFHFLLGQLKISLLHQCFQSDVDLFFLGTFFVCLLWLPLATPPPLLSCLKILSHQSLWCKLWNSCIPFNHPPLKKTILPG